VKEPLSFGEWLRKQRRALDLSRQDLAHQAGCAEITLRRIEAGTLKPSKELASLLLEKVGIPQNKRDQWISFARGQSGIPLEQSGSAPQPQTNLPAPLTSFIGREKELGQITNLLEKHRLVTLIGPGGVGKTRLSLKVGEQLLSNYAHGAWLVELAPLNNPELIPQTITSIFGITSASNLPVTEVLINYLRAKTALLILDNCEHVLDGCVQLADTLLKQCPNLKILATSRETLGILGEASYVVPPLGLPDNEKLLDTYREFDSVRLFDERAQLARHDFALTMDNAPSVAQICHHLDGIPLAIELAAVQVIQFSPAEIAAQLADSFKFLTDGNRTALPRQQTLRASMDWSWNLLTESEQTLLRQLSVFSGGWTLGSALEVCDGDIMSLTGSLVKKSLIVMNQEGRRETRYGFHEVVRQYAIDKLLESGEASSTRDRHLGYFLKFAEPASEGLFGKERIHWSNLFETEYDNLRSVLRWGLDHAPLQVLTLVGFLADFWLTHGYLAEGGAWCSAALDRAENLSYYGRDIDRARARGFQAWARLLNNQGEYRIAREAAEKSIALYRQLGDTKHLARSLIVLGSACAFSGDISPAFDFVHESERISREMGYTSELGWALEVLSYLTFETHGRAAEKEIEAYVQESLALPQEHAWRNSFSKQFLVRKAYERGDFVTARKHAEEALSYYQEMGNTNAYNALKSAMAHGLRQIGNFEEALTIYRETILTYKDLGHRGAIAHQLECFAFIAMAQEQGERTVRLLGAAEALREVSDSRMTPQERIEYDKKVAGLREGMDEEMFTSLWAEGHAMTIEQAIAYALRGD